MDYNKDIIKQKMENIRKDPKANYAGFFDNLKKWDDETLLACLRMMEAGAECAQVGVDCGKDLEWLQLNILFYQEEIKRRKLYE